LLSQESFLGGAQMIDVDAAHRAIEQHLALPMKISVQEAAAGILRIVNAAIADEIRLQASKKGVELSTYSIVAFGGAGPVQAAAVAEELGITTFIVPFSPGAFSALGLLCSDVVHDFMRSDLMAIDKLTPAQIESQFEALEKEAAEVLASEALDVKNCEFIRELDMRYAGQGFELRLGLNGLGKGADGFALDELVESFHSLHETQHGHAARDGSVEVVSYRLRARIKTNKIPLQGNAEAPGTANKTASSRDIQFQSGPKVNTPIRHRLDLERDAVCQGPTVIVQFDTTTIIPPGWAARIDKSGNLIVTRSAA
jgi:N-methylhydantoinase A/oxoprolinase/acetone carboxylase beta subunit